MHMLLRYSNSGRRCGSKGSIKTPQSVVCGLWAQSLFLLINPGCGPAKNFSPVNCNFSLMKLYSLKIEERPKIGAIEVRKRHERSDLKLSWFWERQNPKAELNSIAWWSFTYQICKILWHQSLSCEDQRHTPEMGKYLKIYSSHWT